MEGVRPGDQVEEIAVGVGRVEEAFGGELLPCHPLSSDEEDAEDGGGNQPRSRAPDSRLAEAKPLLHDVDFTKELTPGHLDSEAAEQQDRSVEPQNRRYRQRMPVGDVVAGAVDVAGGL